jgi:hypothetical protein
MSITIPFALLLCLGVVFGEFVSLYNLKSAQVFIRMCSRQDKIMVD